MREGPFENVWIQPAAGDAGGALGAAQLVWHRRCRRPRQVSQGMDAMQGAYLGPQFSPEDIRSFLDAEGALYHELEREDLLTRTARLLDDGNVVGWFDGRMEFGPRALGARSILGDARNARMQSQMNLKIKFRESFRPFAPSVIDERVGDYFELDRESPYMLLVAPLREDRRLPIPEGGQELWGIERLNVRRSEVPAVTHVDYSARIQTVGPRWNPNYYDLLLAFERLTGCPLLVNTSFNVRGEPIVCTPRDAYTCFMRTAMDYLVLWPFLLDKNEQPVWAEEDDWRKTLELD